MTKNSKKVKKSQSLSKEYLLFGSIVLIAVVILAVILTELTHRSYVEERQSKINSVSHTLNRTLIESFAYVEQVMGFVGDKIAQHGIKDKEYLGQLFQQKFDIADGDDAWFSWSLFDFVTPEAKVIVSSRDGVLEMPKSVTNRSYMNHVKTEPWKIHFSDLDVGITSGKEVIPAGMGIVDKAGKYLGAVTMGFSINKLTRNLEAAILEPGMRFMAIDEKGNVVFHSSDITIPTDFKVTNTMLATGGKSPSILAESITLDDNVFTSYHKANRYPYAVLVGYNSKISNAEFKAVLLPRIIESIFIGIFCMMLLLFFRKYIISPVNKLSHIAKEISQNNTDVKIPEFDTYELNILSKQIARTKRLLMRENQNKAELSQAKNELSEAINNLQASDKERESFVREMQRSLKKPIRVILEATALTLDQRLGKLDMNNYGLYFAAIQDAAKQIESFTTEFLHPARVNIHDVLNKCIIIQRRYAEEASIALVNETSEEYMPDIWLDKLRIQQVILSILHHTIFLTPEHKKPSKVVVKAIVEMGYNEPSNVIITVKDNGQGVDEEHFIELWEEKYGDVLDVTKQNLSVVRHLIELHHGTFTLEAKEGDGTCFTVTLPYLEKSDLETHPSELRKNNRASSLPTNKKETPDVKNSPNIIVFPKKKD